MIGITDLLFGSLGLFSFSGLVFALTVLKARREDGVASLSQAGGALRA